MTRLVAPVAPRAGLDPDPAGQPGRTLPRGGTRTLHPWAWWGWALCAGAAISLTTNLALLGMCLAALVLVMVQRRTGAPWARSMRSYLWLAGVVLGIRLVFQVLLGSQDSGPVLFTLPELHLPMWLAGLQVGGPVGRDMLVATLAEALRLVGVLVCVGAANTLANPRRALRNVPAALHEVATAVVIALTVAPQLIESGQRVRVARRLRGTPRRGLRGATSLVVPVLEDAIDRSLALAGSMEARGFGRTARLLPLPRTTTALLFGGMVAMVLGGFCFLGVPGATGWAVAGVLAGLVAVVAGLRNSGRRLAVTRYRPDPWRAPENLTVGCGLAAVAVAGWLQHAAPGQLTPPASPAAWPPLHPGMLLLVLALALPGFITPAPGRDDL